MVLFYLKLFCQLFQPTILASVFTSFFPQGVVKVRRRVTLMVVSVSAIFGTCWITVTVGYMLSQFNFNIFGAASNVISHTLVMFNSAVNPLLYGLLNHKFRMKFKGMLCCCTRSPTFRVHASVKPQGIEVFKITITQPTQKDLALGSISIKQMVLKGLFAVSLHGVLYKCGYIINFVTV